MAISLEYSFLGCKEMPSFTHEQYGSGMCLGWYEGDHNAATMDLCSVIFVFPDFSSNNQDCRYRILPVTPRRRSEVR